MTWQSHINRGTRAMLKSDYGTAEAEFRQARQAAEREWGREDARFRQTLGLLGQTHYHQSNFNEAEALLSQSLEETRQNAGDLTCALSLIQLSAVKRANGDGAGANYRFQQALEMLKHSPRDIDMDVAVAIGSLNQLFSKVQRKERDKSGENFQNLLNAAQQHRAKKPNPNPDPFADTNIDTEMPEANLQNWKALLNDSQDLLSNDSAASDVEAYNKAHDATTMAYRLNAIDDQNTALSLLLLGMCSQRLRQHDQAERLYKRAITIYDTMPKAQSEQKNARLNLAGFYAELHDYRQALNTLMEAAEQVDATSGEATKIQSSLLSSMARAELYQTARETVKQAIEAEEGEHLEHASLLFERALTLLRRVLPEEHPEVAQMLLFKSNVMRKLGQNGAADKLREKAAEYEREHVADASKWQTLSHQLRPFHIPPSKTN